jgi:hypothetical protein
MNFLYDSSVSISSISVHAPIKTVFSGKKDRKPYILNLDIQMESTRSTAIFSSYEGDFHQL